EGHEVIKPGVIFCLEQVGASRPEGHTVNPLQPYYLAYVREDGTVRYTFTHPKQVLEVFRATSRGHTSPLEDLCRAFDERTSHGQDLALENRLLEAAMAQIRDAYAQRAAANLLNGRGA